MTQVTDLQNFAFDGQLVRVISRGGEPWFVAADACAVLGIKNAGDALAGFDDDEKGVASSYTPGGDQSLLVLSEAGLYRLIFQSRKPVAKTFQRWVLHDVLPSIRKTGRYAVVDAPSPERMTEDDLRAAPLLHRLHCIREIRAIRGRHVAAVMWNRLGLPALPPPPMTALDEARQCLRHLLDAVADGQPVTVRELLERALEDDTEAQLLLLACGVRALPECEGFVVANAHPWLANLYRGSEWAAPRGHMRVLRRLPGAVSGAQHRYGGAVQRRGTVLPGSLLDE